MCPFAGSTNRARSGGHRQIVVHDGIMDVNPTSRAARPGTTRRCAGAAGHGATGLIATVALTAATVLAGCQGPGPTDSSVSTPAAAEPISSYNVEELALYREAVRRVDNFEAKNQTILAAGKATRRAKVFYQDSLLRWRSTYERLQSYEQEGIKIARRPVVIRTTALSIKSFQDNAAEVVLRRCTDQSDLQMTRAGVPLPAVHPEPVIQRVVVYRSENRTWRIGPFTTTDTPCAA